MIIKLFEEFTYTGVQDHFGLGIKFTDALQQSYLELKNNPNISWAVFDIDNDNFIANSDNYDQNVEGGSVPKVIAGACALHKNGGDFDSTHDMWKLQKLLVNSNNEMWPPIQKLAGGGDSVNEWSNRMGWDNMKPSTNSRLINAKGMSYFWRDTLNKKYKGAEIIETLSYGCETGTYRIRKYLPKEIKVGHKTGTMVTQATQLARNDSGWIITLDGRRIGITVLTQYFGKSGEEKIAIMAGGLYREYCLNNNHTKHETTQQRDSTLKYWQPKSGVVFLPTEGKGVPQEESINSFLGFGKENYPWVGLPDGVKKDTTKPLQYVTLIPGGGDTFENLLDKVNSGKFDSLRPNTIIFVLWNSRRNETAIQADLKDIMKYLNVSKINSISNQDLNKVKQLLK